MAKPTITQPARSLPRIAWDACNEAAAAVGLEPALVRAICWVESRGNPMAVSPVGATGLLQLMPATAKQYGVLDAYNAKQNALGGAKFFGWLLQRYGVPADALCAYNWGPRNMDAVRANKRAVPGSVALYAASVLNRWEVEKTLTAPFQGRAVPPPLPSPASSSGLSSGPRSPQPLRAPRKAGDK